MERGSGSHGAILTPHQCLLTPHQCLVIILRLFDNFNLLIGVKTNMGYEGKL